MYFPNPITFLITDILSEIYGRKKTRALVYTGLAASIFVLFILFLGHQFHAIEGSPVNDLTYETAFANSWRIVASSIIAYIFAQLIDTSLEVLVLFIGVKISDEIFAFILDG